MMEWTVVTTKDAECDIIELYEYIAFTLGERDIALGQVQRISDKIDTLDHMPHRFRAIEDEPWRSEGWHIVAENQYQILYCIDDERHLVVIMAVMHSSQDLRKRLQRLRRP